MATTTEFAEIANLVGDPARANILISLMDGRALTASELAHAAGVTPQTASSHLGRLLRSGLLLVEQQGRHRYHRLASAKVAAMLEGIMGVAERAPGESGAKPVVTGPRDAALRVARTCYDHLAGQLGVGIADALVAKGHIELSGDGGLLTADGADFFHAMGIEPEPPASRPKRGRIFCRPCLDWSERRVHVAGAVGAAICTACFDKGWVRRLGGTRALEITHPGRQAFRAAFDLSI